MNRRTRNRTKDRVVTVNHALSRRQLQLILAGGLINAIRRRGQGNGM
jgi:hypothetical protein